MNDFCGIFIKFGAEEHLLQLQKEGLLYCNPLKYFLDIEDGFLRGDKLENVLELGYMENGILEIKSLKNPNANHTTYKVKNVKFTTSRIDAFANIYCLHAVNGLEKNEGEVFALDSRNRSFGSHFLIIKDTIEFLNRLKKKLEESNLAYEHTLVDYVDFSKYKGKKSVFQKDLVYKFQKEFRLLVYNKTEEVIKIKLGDISDITILYDAKYIETLKMKIRYLENGDVIFLHKIYDIK